MSNREEKKARVIEVLNKARSMELQAIHQYMNQHYNLDDRDLGELAKNIKLIAIDEMTHAEAFAERIRWRANIRIICSSSKGSRNSKNIYC